MLYLTRQQIQAYVDRIGQPEASVLLHRFLVQSVRHLDSSDVTDLYDEEFFERIDRHPVHACIGGQFTVNVYNGFAFDYLLPQVAGKRVLDVGCGRGDFALAVASSGARSVVGVDTSATSVAMAEDKRRHAGLSNATFLAESVARLPGPDPFDFIVLNDVTEHLSDRELTTLLQDLEAQVRPGSQLVIHTPNGLSLSHESDTGLLPLLYKAYLIVARGWRGVARPVDELYYEQTHINLKSFRQLRDFLRPFGYRCHVRYDSPTLKGIPGTERLSPNMLVLATKI
jgi:2-polyprenyl-3-methyl-5-hydroxy-6-metoxy-1,4-benzoquinol methylase